MQKIEILVVCAHEEILKVILRLINVNPWWNATGSSTPQDARLIFATTNFDLVLLGAGIEEEQELQLTADFKILNPEVRIVKHYGGGSGLLSAEIYQALQI